MEKVLLFDQIVVDDINIACVMHEYVTWRVLGCVRFFANDPLMIGICLSVHNVNRGKNENTRTRAHVKVKGGMIVDCIGV